MRKRDAARHQLGRFWLYQRPDTATWFICWLDNGERGRVGADGARGRARTRRKATGVGGGRPDSPPQAALDALAAHHLEFGQQRKLNRDDALLENLMAEWLTHHVARKLAAPERYLASTEIWTAFFDREIASGHLPAKITVRCVTPKLVERFIAWRAGQGVGGHTISRDLAALRGPLNWAWKNHLLDSAPFVADVAPEDKAPPRDRVLSFEELALIMEACLLHPYRQHVLRFIVIELGTAGRPEAVLQLTDANIDLARGLLDPNQPDERRRLRKRLTIVPIARHVRPWVMGIEGKLIRYEAVTKSGETVSRATGSIKTAWNRICAEVGVEGATPKTLRHTMLTWLAERDVPEGQRSKLAGHAPQTTTGKNYEHLTPGYLRAAVLEIDAFFEELAKHTKAHLRSVCDPLAGSAAVAA